MPEQAYKRCPRCGETKPVEQFNRNRTKKDGRHSSCKVCHRAQSRAWHADNHERSAANKRRWEKANPESKAASRKRWEEKNPEKVAAKQRRYRQGNRAEIAERERRYRAANPEMLAAKNKRHAEKYPEKARARRMVGEAVYEGRLAKPTRCEGCGNEKPPAELDGHHADYSKPLEVEWLCRPCHSERHS